MAIHSRHIYIVFVSHKYNILINQYNFSQSSTSTVSNYPPPPPPPNFSSVVSLCCIPLLFLPWIRLSRWLYSWTSHILGVLFGVLRGDGGRLKEREREIRERQNARTYVLLSLCKTSERTSLRHIGRQDVKPRALNFVITTFPQSQIWVCQEKSHLPSHDR